jgi:hypothetical protein
MGREHHAEDATGKRPAKLLEAALARLLLNQGRDRPLVRRDRVFTQVIRQPLGAVSKRLRRQALHQTLESIEIDLAAVDPQRQIQCEE